MDRLTQQLVRAVAAAPCSLRALAEEAHVSHSLLVFITAGKRRATPAVADAVADALERWGARCSAAAQQLRRAKGSTRHPRRAR